MTKNLFASLLLAALTFSGATAQTGAKTTSKARAYSVAGKKAAVYTTAANTQLRLARR